MKIRLAGLRLVMTLIGMLVAVQAAHAQRPLKVVASFTILADMATQIGGDLVTVTTLVGPDADTHVYQPTPQDAVTLSQADLVIVNGLGFEGWIDRLIQSSGFRGTPVVASQGVRAREMVDDDAPVRPGQRRPTVTDPHAWNSMANGQIYARNIGAALARAMPAQAERLRAATDAYVARLAALDADARRTFGVLPAQKRRAITSHDAFGYFGAAYGIIFLSPVGFSTEGEPSARHVAALIRQIRREHIRALFVENITEPRLVQQIAREVGGVVGPRLYSDALSPRGGPADTYEAMFRYNVTTLAEGLARN